MCTLSNFIKKKKKYLILSFMSSIFCFLVCCDSEKSTINRGHRWFDRGKFDYAIQTYSQAVKINPENPDIYFYRGLAKFNAKDIEGAEVDFTRSIKLNPMHVGAYINRGLLFNQKGEFDKALSDCNKAIELKPNEYRAYLVRAEVWFYKRDFDKSIDDCNFIIKNNSQMAVAYRSRADAFYWKQEYKNAIRDYLKAIELNQKDSLAYNNLAWILSTCEDEKFRDGKRALFFAKKAVDLNPSFINLSTLSAAYAENSMFEDAVKVTKKIVFVEKDLNEKNKKHLKLFQNHQPLREKPGN
jgi:tetratricopeptide (TPR) repeat protein